MMFYTLKLINQLFVFVILLSSCSSSEFLVPTKDGRIIGGSPISISKAKYQVSLRVKSRELSRGFGNGHICGGSVITHRLIATAAHCVQNYVAKDLTVVMGNTLRSVPDHHQLQYNIQQVIRHQDFDITTLINDIALLFINGYIPWNWPTVKAIELNKQATAINSVCSVSGWGKRANGQMSLDLYQANVPIVSYQQCYSDNVDIPLTMICAGYISLGGVDACQGDSGGPFVCHGLLTGIVSWGDGCALANRPGVYTNVSAFYEWVVKANNSLNYTLYNGATDIRLNIFLSILLVIRLLYVFI